jgi:hypothetical protein
LTETAKEGLVRSEIKFVSPEQFSQISGLSLKTVYRRIWDGSLGAVQPGGPKTRWLIPGDVLENAHAGPETSSIPARVIAEAVTSPAFNTAKPPLPGPRPLWTRHQRAADR